MDTNRIAAVATLWLLVLGGCWKYEPVAASGLAPGSEVRVLLSSPLSVTAEVEENGATRSALLPAVQSVEGRVLSIGLDTLRIRAAHVTDTTGFQPYASVRSATVPLGWQTSTLVRRLDAMKTGAVVLGAGFAAALLFAWIGSQVEISSMPIQ